MKNAQVYYQDFFLNSDSHNDDDLKIDKENSVFISGFIFDDSTPKEECADRCFRALNLEPEKYADTMIFARAGHTSMSIGDYIKFNDDTILMCARIGWLKI